MEHCCRNFGWNPGSGSGCHWSGSRSAGDGKALLFKYLGGVDAFPLTLDTKDPDEIIKTVLILQPGLGGVNLEDISQPKCFYVLDTLRKKARIPV